MGQPLSPFQGANEAAKFIQAAMNAPTNLAASGVAMTVANIDGSPIGTNITVSGAGTTPQTPDYVRLEDGTSGTLATITQFHASDNQALGSGNGLYTGGVAQIVNQPGTLDRARETGIDQVAAVGLPAGSQQLAVPFNSSVVANITAGANRIVTPANMSGIKVGSQVLVDSGTAQETVVVTATTLTTFTATFVNSHTGPGIPTLTFWYNQARDASTGDLITASGLSPSATYLFNSAKQVFEYDRSANGELDGASGQGTAVAAEYEFNGGGPGTAVSQSGVNNFDRARNLSGKGFTSSNITAGGGAGSTAVTLLAATGLQAGAPIYFDITVSGTQEVAYTVPTYAPGTNPVYLQTALINSHTNASWDTYTPNGPGLNGFLATGIGIEEEALYNPVDGKFYIERSATQDGVAAANVVLESVALWNGTAMDRQRGNLDNISLLSGTFTTTQTGTDQTNYNARGVIVTFDITAGTTLLLTLEIDYKDPVSGKYVALLTGVQQTAVGTTSLTIYPGNTVAANVSASTILPRTWRVKVTAGNANSATYTIGASLLV
ncbi:MAG TPA: hypothetical protein VNX65_02390 [Patescibacteria group bacterium]|jgi:hypothetical protein|nr:hypothetical protein [Patescibacteria group bacterium]